MKWTKLSKLDQDSTKLFEELEKELSNLQGVIKMAKRQTDIHNLGYMMDPVLKDAKTLILRVCNNIMDVVNHDAIQHDKDVAEGVWAWNSGFGETYKG